ncbi:MULTISPECIES: helix-turn-helix domain-containing protein [unclassified Curtobacterium]|uniref:helix-turn-helix domain-containing protein n=1 Tax=unclassified Curtobacterium TaxID=257496 RepID=UPI0015E8D8B4|nr:MULTISPECIES: helix-turn-helix domain-containing protein [unclassified Curtobacterium]WIB13340.1 helix-turn-helix domain-containing protein [Curtobacterium sp. MCPF17_052]
MAISTPHRPRNATARTYVPADAARDGLVDFARQLHESFGTSRHAGAALRAPDGSERPIPAEIFEVLEQVADALASGSGVTVAPNDMQMTTQQAADFLGVSRPTLIKYLEEGTIPFGKRGRHRRVLLRDVVAFQEAFRIDRKAALREMARNSQSLERQQAEATGD